MPDALTKLNCQVHADSSELLPTHLTLLHSLFALAALVFLSISLMYLTNGQSRNHRLLRGELYWLSYSIGFVRIHVHESPRIANEYGPRFFRKDFYFFVKEKKNSCTVGGYPGPSDTFFPTKSFQKIKERTGSFRRNQDSKRSFWLFLTKSRFTLYFLHMVGHPVCTSARVCGRVCAAGRACGKVCTDTQTCGRVCVDTRMTEDHVTRVVSFIRYRTPTFVSLSRVLCLFYTGSTLWESATFGDF
jgi:hypothetical protein